MEITKMASNPILSQFSLSQVFIYLWHYIAIVFYYNSPRHHNICASQICIRNKSNVDKNNNVTDKNKNFFNFFFHKQHQESKFLQQALYIFNRHENH